MRASRPKAVTYNYDIAAVWGVDTPLDPRGQLVEPGRYTAVLTVNGQSQQVPVELVADPRVVGADYHAAREFSDSLYAPMDIAWRGYAEQQAARDELGKGIAQIRDPALLAQATALLAKLQPPKAPHAGFEAESGTLATLETSAEQSDSAPTPALRQTAIETIAQVNSDWAAWRQVKTTDLDQLNRSLSAAGLQSITIPTGEALRAKPPEGGADLP
jgi:hypothetical protein